MRGRSSSKHGKLNRVGVSMEKDKVDKVKEEPHLSGAYIRSLVKHLTSTRPKDPFDGAIVITSNADHHHHNMKQESPPPPPPPQPQPPQPPPPPPQIKKQVRRRQHTTRPYQERLLNMAEARREIVTALKFHRASMKQQEAATTAIASVPHYWAIPTVAPPPLPPLYQENLNFHLPNQTLGLNLNFQDFKNIDANLYQHPLSIYPTSSSSSSSSSSCSSSSTSSSAAISGGEAAAGMVEVVAGSLHHAMDDVEIEEIKSLGEQHQMEWNDTVNLMMSARWLKFLKTMDEEAKVDTQKDEFYRFNPFDQIVEFPPWLSNANEQHFHDRFSDDYLQDSALSCMDIGEIEGMDDGEWLA